MAKLKKADLELLAHSDGGRINMVDRDKIKDPTSRQRLEENGLIDPKGYLTDEGKKMLDSVNAQAEQLLVGIPFVLGVHDKKVSEELFEIAWDERKVNDHQIITDGGALFLGKREGRMSQKVTFPEVYIEKLFHKYIDGAAGLHIVYPHTLQIAALHGVTVVWLTDDKQKRPVVIQLKYLAYALHKFKNVAFLASDEKATPIRVFSKGSKGIAKSIVGLIMPVDVSKTMLRGIKARKDFGAVNGL